MLSSIASDLAAAGCRRFGRASCLAPAAAPPGIDLDFTERLIRLRMSRPFARAPIRSLAALAQRAELRRWSRGGLLWEGGHPSKEIVTLVEGTVREGRTTLRACDTVGLPAALAGRRRDTFAVARAPTVGIVFDVEALSDALEDDDELALTLLRAAAEELLAMGVSRGLPPDVVGAAPEVSLPRVLQVAASSR